MKNSYVYETAIGKLYISENDGAITDIKYCDGDVTEETPLIRKTLEQINEYLNGDRLQFDIPLQIEGSEFQVRVWNALLTIPYGETRCYKDIAEQIGSPKSCRAVGGANNRNPISIIIPCHRVIGSGGSLTGYAGGLDVKQSLLKLERSHKPK